MKFQAHGIKTQHGVERCTYMISHLVNGEKCITVYAKSYERFSAEIKSAFDIQNDTDSQSDYFENDRFRVYPGHALFNEVLAGAIKNAEFGLKRCTKGGAYNWFSNRIAELQQFAA